MYVYAHMHNCLLILRTYIIVYMYVQYQLSVSLVSFLPGRDVKVESLSGCSTEGDAIPN